MDHKFLLFLCRSRSLPPDSGLSMLEVLVAMMVVFFTMMGALNGLLYATLFQVKAERQAQATYWIQQDLEQVKSLAASQSSDPTNKCNSVFTTSYAGDLQSTLGSNTTMTGTSPAAASVTTPLVGRRQSQLVKTSETSTTFSTHTTKKLMGKEYRLVRITEGYNDKPQILKITYRVGLPTDSTSDTDRIQDDTTNNTSILATLYTEVMPPQALSCS
jgi:Tfp pilus assembly protein PilV